MKKCKRKSCMSDGICRDGCCVSHTESSPVKRDYAHRTYPRSDAPHLGVEIECFAPSAAIHRLLTLQKEMPCEDASLPSYGCEFKVCRPVKKAIAEVCSLVRKLSAFGAKVNSDCGLHVHLDAREVSMPRIQEFLDWLKVHQEEFYGLMPPSRRNNHFVCPLPHTGHYAWAHYTTYYTVEIRIHPGSLNPHKVSGWLHVCASLLALLRSDRPFPESIWDAFDEIGGDYLRARQSGDGVLESGYVLPDLKEEVE